MQYTDIDRLLIYAIRLIEEDNLYDAKTIISLVLKSAPLNADAHYLGAFTYKLGSTQEVYLSNALLNNPRHWQAIKALRTLHQRQRKSGSKCLDVADFAVPPRLEQLRTSYPDLLDNINVVFTAFTAQSQRQQSRNNTGMKIAGVLFAGIALLIAVWLLYIATPNQILETAGLPVTLAPDTTPARVLDFTVIDAEYSQALDSIITVSGNPPQLHILNPTTLEYVTVDLPRHPKEIALHPDGLTAVITHTGLLSVVNLSNATINYTQPFETDIIGLFVTEDNFAYFTEYGVYGFIGSPSPDMIRFDLTARETIVFNELSHSIEDVQVHPDGQRVYSIFTGNATYLTRIDLSDPPQLNNSRHRITRPPCDRVWLSADGELAYTNCGGVFSLTADLETDMTSYGELSDAEDMFAFAEVSEHNALLGVIQVPDSSPYESYMVRWDSETFEITQHQLLPFNTINGIAYASQAQWMFVNNSQDTYYVLTAVINSRTDEEIGTGIIAGGTNDISKFEPLPVTPYSPITQPVIFEQEAVFTEFFDHSIVDSAYSETLNLIVMSDEEGTNLHIYDLATQVSRTVELSTELTGFQIDPSGLHVITYHDSLLTYIDLESASIIQTFNVPGEIIKAQMSDEFAYLHISNTPTRFGVINLQTGQFNAFEYSQSLNSRMYLNSELLRLLIFNTTNSGRADLTVYSIDPESPNSIIDSWDFDLDLVGYSVIASDLSYLYSSQGYLYRWIDSEPSERPFFFEGRLPDLPPRINNRVRHYSIQQSPANNMLIELTDDYLMVWNRDTLDLIRAMYFTNTNPEFSSDVVVRAVFINADESQIYLLVRAFDTETEQTVHGIIRGNFDWEWLNLETETD